MQDRQEAMDNEEDTSKEYKCWEHRWGRDIGKKVTVIRGMNHER